VITQCNASYRHLLASAADDAVLFNMHIFVGLLLIFLYEVGVAAILPTQSEIPMLGYNYILLAWIFVFVVLGKMLGTYIVFFGGRSGQGDGTILAIPRLSQLGKEVL